MKFNVHLERRSDDVSVEIKNPRSDGTIATTVMHEVNVYDVRNMLITACRLGKQSCGASVDMRTGLEVSCTINQCPFPFETEQ